MKPIFRAKVFICRCNYNGSAWQWTVTGIILGVNTANERWRYILTSFLIGWAQAQNDPCNCSVMLQENCQSIRFTVYKKLYHDLLRNAVDILNRFNYLPTELQDIFFMLKRTKIKHILRADSRFVPSQWETVLHCNGVSHWLGASLESALHTSNTLTKPRTDKNWSSNTYYKKGQANTCTNTIQSRMTFFHIFKDALIQSSTDFCLTWLKLIFTLVYYNETNKDIVF